MNNTIAPSFLLAPPSLHDPNFRSSVVLVASHEDEGTMGFVLSQPTALSFHELLEDLKIKPLVPDRPVLLGGPVSKDSGFILYEHRANKPLAPGFRITSTLSVSPSRQLLEMAANGKITGRFDLILGYAAWAPGQLENELEQGGWLHAPLDKEIVFEVPLLLRWQTAYARLGVSPLGFINVPGGAQA